MEHELSIISPRADYETRSRVREAILQMRDRGEMRDRAQLYDAIARQECVSEALVISVLDQILKCYGIAFDGKGYLG